MNIDDNNDKLHFSELLIKKKKIQWVLSSDFY